MIIKTARGTAITTPDLAPGFNPDLYERLGPVWKRIEAELADQQWHPWRAVIAAVEPKTDVQPKTIEGLIYRAVTGGRIQRRGRYSHKTRTDQREIRLANNRAS